MQLNTVEQLELINKVVNMVSGAIGKQSAKIRELEEKLDHGLTILDNIEAGKVYPAGTMARQRGGTFQLQDGEWKCVSRGIHKITGKPTADGMALVVELSDGSFIERELTLPNDHAGIVVEEPKQPKTRARTKAKAQAPAKAKPAAVAA